MRFLVGRPNMACFFLFLLLPFSINFEIFGEIKNAQIWKFHFEKLFRLKFVQFQISCSNSKKIKLEFVEIQTCSNSNLFIFEFVQTRFCSDSNLFKLDFVQIQNCSISILFRFNFVQIWICSKIKLFKICSKIKNLSIFLKKKWKNKSRKTQGKPTKK
jgi:hypothetical protein